MEAREASAAAPSVNEVSTFLTATAMVLRETIARFEMTTARILEHILKRPGDANRDLIVTLQDFDRLQQEFVTLAEVLTQAAAKSSESWHRVEGRGHPAEDALAHVSMGELKERLMRSLGISIFDLGATATAEEAEF
jgi:hypothetical protein